MNDLGSTLAIDQIVQVFMQAMEASYAALVPVGQFLQVLLAALSIIAAGFAIAAGDIRAAFGKTLGLIVGGFIFASLIANMGMVIKAAARDAVGVGLMAANAAGYGETITVDQFFVPSQIVGRGLVHSKVLWDYMGQLCHGWASCIQTGFQQIMVLIAILVMVAVYYFIAVYMVMTLLKLYIFGLAAVPALGTTAHEKTAWIAERMVAGIVACLLSLMMVSAMVGVAEQVFIRIPLPQEPDIQSAVMIGCGHLLVGYIVWQSGSLVREVVNGAPSFGNHSLWRMAANGLAAMSGTAAAIKLMTNRTVGGAAAMGGGARRGVSGAMAFIKPPTSAGAGSTAGSAASQSVGLRQRLKSATTAYRTGVSGGARGTGWSNPPTAKQMHAARMVGVTLAQGETRGSLSLKLEAAGYDPSWYRTP